MTYISDDKVNAARRAANVRVQSSRSCLRILCELKGCTANVEEQALQAGVVGA